MRAEALIRRSPAAFVVVAVIDLIHRLAVLYHSATMNFGAFTQMGSVVQHEMSYAALMQSFAGLINSASWLAYAIVIEIMLAIHDRLQVRNA
jgi:hypothetical protein